MNRIELANSLIEQGTKILLQESAGSHGLSRRIEIAHAEDRINQADKAIEILKKIKEKTRSKHRLENIDERIRGLEGAKNSYNRDKSRSERELDYKKEKSKDLIRKYGKDLAISKMKRDTNVSEGLANAYMKNHKKAQNESISELINESNFLLDESSEDFKGYLMEKDDKYGYYKAYDPDGNFIGNVDNRADFEYTVKQYIEQKKEGKK